jgi:hypothetical protein
MEWMKQMGPILDQYRTATATQAPATVHNDYERFAEAAPQEAISEGLSAAFRSDETPPFSQMASQLFGGAGGTQRARMLNALLTTVGPLVLQQILARRQQGGSPAASAGGGFLDQILHPGGPAKVTPEVAEKVSPAEVEEIAKEAEKRDPSVIDRVSEIFAEQPHLLKVLGGAALAIALGSMARKHGTL